MSLKTYSIFRELDLMFKKINKIKWPWERKARSMDSDLQGRMMVPMSRGKWVVGPGTSGSRWCHRHFGCPTSYILLASVHVCVSLVLMVTELLSTSQQCAQVCGS